MTRIIVSHVSPDWDAICSLWLLQRFGGFEDATIALVNTGNPDPDVLASAAAVVDTGRKLDPLHNRFDHHQLLGAEANDCCAASLVFQWLKPLDNPAHLEYLAPLIDLIYAGDTGKPAANPSRQLGIHALLSAWKARKVADTALIAIGYDVLDDLAAHLKRASEAAPSLDQHTVYRSADGLLIALDGAAQGATFAAFEAGAQLVVWYSPQEGTIAVGINRAPESGIDCGGLILGLLNDSECNVGPVEYGGPIYLELCTWYRHNSGFFAGRGTAKAPDTTPLRAPIVDIAAALDAAWRR